MAPGVAVGDGDTSAGALALFDHSQYPPITMMTAMMIPISFPIVFLCYVDTICIVKSMREYDTAFECSTYIYSTILKKYFNPDA